LSSAGEEQDLREGKIVRVGDGQERRSRAEFGKPSSGAAVKLQVRRAAVPHNLDVAPEDAPGVAGAERFHGRFFRGKASGEMNGRHAPPHGVGDFAVREHALQKPNPVSRDGGGDAVDIRCVQAEPDDV